MYKYRKKGILLWFRRRIKDMFFSERFEVDSKIIEEYGAVDISLVCDMPLFVDPMLIFNSEKSEYKALHCNIIKYFHFLYEKSQQGLTPKEIDAWFNFSEVPNNWLGYSLEGNRGLALGRAYARYLYNNIGFAIKTNGISQSEHIEKVMLLYKGSGKDKISDLTVNLIKGFLCEYTEKFAKKYVDKKYLKRILVEKAKFNYETESFVSKEYVLPYIYSEENKMEYVLLSPSDILREDEPAINRKDFLKSYDKVRAVIQNDSLRAYVNNYIGMAVRKYEDEQKRNKKRIYESSVARIEREAFGELVNECPELYDYYIKYKENCPDEIKKVSSEELNVQIEKLITASKNLINIFENKGYEHKECLSAREEAKNRIKFFKHIIEDCDGYKNLYVNGKQIAQENDLQRLFKYVWYGTNFKIDAETNNGRGYSDFIISKGQYNQNIVEFKLASNSKLSHVFEQVKVYEAANCAENSLIVIFFFSEEEYRSVNNIVKNAGCTENIEESIFLVDCRMDNKKSASKV